MRTGRLARPFLDHKRATPNAAIVTMPAADRPFDMEGASDGAGREPPVAVHNGGQGRGIV